MAEAHRMHVARGDDHELLALLLLLRIWFLDVLCLCPEGPSELRSSVFVCFLKLFYFLLFCLQ